VTETQAANANDSAVEYRFRCFLPDAIFAADRTNRPRDVAVDVAAQVNLRQQPVEIHERVEYNVRFEPLSELVFEVPGESRIEEGAVEVALLANGVENESSNREGRAETLLRPVSKTDDDGMADATRDRRLHVALPQPRLGRFAVELRYTVGR